MFKRIALAGIAVMMTACDALRIDEDLSVCGRDAEIVYTVRLLTNLQTELRTELTTAQEQVVSRSLETALRDYFNERAHDIDLSFFNEDNELAYNENHVINANEASYTIYLPAQNYRHFSVANTTAYSNLLYHDKDVLASFAVQQAAGDTLDSHSSGLFTARANINIEDIEADQVFNVILYMQNSAVALVLDPADIGGRAVRGCLVGLADGFQVNDSTYSYDRSVPVRMMPLADNTSGLYCLYGKAFPSRDALPPAAAPLRATRADTTADESQALWQIHVFVTNHDGTVTQTRLFIPTSLPAGELRILKGTIAPDGHIIPSLQQVGVSVTLDWKPGGTFNPTL